MTTAGCRTDNGVRKRSAHIVLPIQAAEKDYSAN